MSNSHALSMLILKQFDPVGRLTAVGEPSMAARPTIKPIDEIISKDDLINIHGRPHICKSGINRIAEYYRLDCITDRP